MAVVLLAAVGTFGSLFGGPALGEHDAIVAECARQMRLSGDWLVPVFMEVPFIRKSPLPYWLVAAGSYVLPHDAATGQPVSAMAARLPSAVSGFITILLLWRLASSMFGRRVGIVAAVMASSSVALLLYSANATAEMLLTCCCTWAFLHFWYGVTTGRAGIRFLHMMLFYVALGLAMMAKGPAPFALTVWPLAVWWYTNQPLRILSRRGFVSWGLTLRSFLRGLRPQTARALTRLWLVPGLFLFGLMFIPWMWRVAERYPHAWDLWNWQYWQRAQGHYEDTRPRGWFYYLPVIAGLVLPYLHVLCEGIAAPWLKRHARRHRPLLFAGLWALMGVVAMSAMSFKKPYYILPAMPGLLLLMSVVADRFYAWSPLAGGFWWAVGLGRFRRSIVVANPARLAWALWSLLAAGLVAGLIGGGVWLSSANQTGILFEAMLIAAGASFLLLIAGVVYIQGRGSTALALTATAAIAAFLAIWYVCGPAIENAEKARSLALALDEAGVPRHAKVHWVDGKPDSRLNFYFQRYSTQLVKPSEIVTRIVDRTKSGAKEDIYLYVLDRAESALGADEAVFLILEKKHYDMWKQFAGTPGQILAIVDSDPDTSRKDWVIVTNTAGLSIIDAAPGPAGKSS